MPKITLSPTLVSPLGRGSLSPMSRQRITSPAAVRNARRRPRRSLCSLGDFFGFCLRCNNGKLATAKTGVLSLRRRFRRRQLAASPLKHAAACIVSVLPPTPSPPLCYVMLTPPAPPCYVVLCCVMLCSFAVASVVSVLSPFSAAFRSAQKLPIRRFRRLVFGSNVSCGGACFVRGRRDNYKPQADDNLPFPIVIFCHFPGGFSLFSAFHRWRKSRFFEGKK